MRLAVLGTLCLLGCGSPGGGPFRFDLAGDLTPRDGGALDLSSLEDLATTGDPDLATDQGGTCPLKINELMATGNGGASDEFIEIHNPCAEPADLTGMTLVYRAAMGASDLLLLTFNGTKVARGGWLVAGQQAYQGMADVRYAFTMAQAGGAVALLAPSMAIVDSVGWGTATNAYVEKNAAAATMAGASIGRSPDGVDSDDNGRDFRVHAQPTPGAKNP